MTTVSRLIQNFIPTNYDLSFTLDRIERSFHGVVTIHGESTDSFIPLHSKDLTITSVVVDGHAGEFTHGEHDELRITSESLQPGDHVVVVSFTGTITDAMHGLYPSHYEQDGVKKELLATQFESHHAREVFPCVDEPEAKATFDLTLTTEPDIVVLSNQPVLQQKTENGKLVTSFQTTPRMSTYLLAWVTGDLHKKTAHTVSGVEVNVWASAAQRPEALDFALDFATRTIDFYEEYFDTPYPLQKSDHVALPDFSSGAMENWGLVTYREIALLADPATTTLGSKQYIATVIAHELAHMWFGNLVTMKWWNNLWLNESFASMIEYLAVDAIHPEWNAWLDFASHESIAALRRDAIDGVQPVQTDVNHPDEISTLFDGAIVYAKGARLLKMLRTYVGDEAFRAGLQQYFRDHAYRNTEADDLWQAIADASGEDIKALMNTWISQPGYPVLHVSKNGADITLRQERFFIGPHTPADTLWPIPLQSSCDEMPALLTEREVTITRTHTSTLRFNIENASHYITHYDDELMGDIIQGIADGSITPIERLQILHEATLLARGGVMPSSQLIPLIDAFRNETSEPVWSIIYLTLVELRKFVEEDASAEQSLRALSGSVARAQYERLGWDPIDGQSDEDTKLRSTIISLMLYSEDSDVLTAARERYDTHTLETLDPELRSLIISSAVRHGEPQLVDDLLSSYASTQNVDLAQDIALGITSTKDTAKINQLLVAMKDPAIVRPQDVFRWFVYLIRGRDSRALTWHWLQDNWQWVIDTFGGDKSYDDFPRYAAGGLTTHEQLEEYIAFFTPKRSIAALTRTIDLGVKEIQARVELIDRDAQAVRSKLQDL